MYHNFTDISCLNYSDLSLILKTAKQVKANPLAYSTKMLGKNAILLLEKHSTRTRLSFEFAVKELGGIISVLNSDSTQIARGESMEDTANVFCRYCDVIIHRTFNHDRLLKCKNAATINALTDKSHPCQIMADILTFIKHKGDIKNKKIAWIGDINNVLYSWIEAAEKLDFIVNICAPDSIKKINSNNVQYFGNKYEAVSGCDAVTTDTWVSMGENKDKIKLFDGLIVDESVMERANTDAIFLHCLPCYRGYEVSEQVMQKYENVVFDEAENRLHVQKAILLWCLKLI